MIETIIRQRCYGTARAATGATYWLGVESAVSWIQIFICTRLTQSKRCHGGYSPVIGRIFDNGVTRATCGAVYKGMEITSMVRVKQLRATGRTEGKVWRDIDGCRIMTQRGADCKIRKENRFWESVNRNITNDCGWRPIILDGLNKVTELGCSTGTVYNNSV